MRFNAFAYHPNRQWCICRILPRLEEPEEGVDRVVLLYWGEGEWWETDVTSILLLSIESRHTRLGRGCVIGNGDVFIDGRFHDIRIFDPWWELCENDQRSCQQGSNRVIHGRLCYLSVASPKSIEIKKVPDRRHSIVCFDELVHERGQSTGSGAG